MGSLKWISSKEIMPEKDSYNGFLVITDNNNTAPLHAHFDEFSKRFFTYVHQIGSYIQIPSIYWMEVPNLPNEVE